MTVIRIKNLRLRAIVGVFEWEKKNSQDIVINLEVETDCADPCAARDELSNVLDYKKLNKKIISFVESGNFNLLETLAGKIAKIALDDDRALKAVVRIDKPGALRFADSVSVTHTAEKTR